MAETATQYAQVLAIRRAHRNRRRAARAAIILGTLAVIASFAALGAYIYDLRSGGELFGRHTHGSDPIIAAPPQLPDEALPGFLEVDADKARDINAQTPISADPLEPAAAFRLPLSVASTLSSHSALDCLTAAIYYEAASESAQGQRAVAQVVLNRMRHPAYPHSICGVVYQGSERRTGCQFSFTCDGSLARKPSAGGWARARGVAAMALNGFVEPSVGTATHYHADYVVPRWASSLDKVATIGAHIFYRWRGFWGKGKAFTGNYAGEPELVMGSAQAAAIAANPALAPPSIELPPVPLGPRPTADEAVHDLLPKDFVVPQADDRLRRDEMSGALKADEGIGTLVPSDQRR